MSNFAENIAEEVKKELKNSRFQSLQSHAMGKHGRVFHVLPTSATNYTQFKQDHPDYRSGDGVTTVAAVYNTANDAYDATVASQGDIVYVQPGHSETIDAATDLVMDKAGVTIVCLGSGANMPVFTFSTATAAAIPVSGANNRWVSGKFVCNIASQNHMFDVAATDFTIEDAFFTEGTATGLSFITADTLDADSNRLTIKRCRFYAPTAGNMDNAIQLAKDHVGVRIEDCDIYGDFDDAGIHIPAGGNACLDLAIRRCRVVNLLTNTPAISINGNTCTGEIVDCRLGTDTKSTALDNGSLRTHNVRWHDGTDQVGDSPIFSEPDSATNILGADDSDNGFASTNVTINDDGSVLERLEGLKSATVLARGTFTTSSTTVPADTGRTEVNDYWNGCYLVPVTGSAAFQPRLIVDFANAGGVFTLDVDVPFTTAPGTVAYVIVKGSLSLAPTADSTANTTTSHVVGIKTDASVYVPGTTKSVAAYVKGHADLQERVAKKTAATMTNGQTLFTVAGGPIIVLGLVSICETGNDGTASTLQYSATPTSGSAQTLSAASASLANAAAGGSVSLIGTALATAALYNSNGPNLGMTNMGGIMVPIGTITAVIGVGSTTGTWAHYLRYKPLATGVTVS